MGLENHDVKTEGDSSTFSTAASANAADVNEGVDSSSTQASATGEANTPTLESVLADKFKELSSQDKPADEAKDESGVRLSNKTKSEDEAKKSQDDKDNPEDDKSAEKTDEEETKEDEKTTEDKVDKGPVPYERFQEVTTAKAKFQEQLESQKEVVQAQQQIVDFCQKNQITPEEFQNWMEIAALSKNNPELALQKLQPTVEGLKSYTGDALPADLQSDVDAGVIPLEYAKRLAKAENQRKFGERQSQATRQQLVEQQQQQYVGEMQRTLSNWMTSKKGTDPDFAPKSKPELPHGKFEHFLNEFSVQVKDAKVSKVADLLVIADKAYATVEASFKHLTPKRNGTVHVASTKSATSKPSKPATVEEAIAARASVHGLSIPDSLTRR